ncbi:Plant self-incompatibility response [Arabidopsis suecica]|uniref:Plant self-incompatibility response n=1 Tax=Arabidopsis suecica TaxID=45249 RepID=A0A8T1ZXZ1_ARASU|nr:Plant self-incompatibility response [Arabidopsis suecica]
MRSATLFMFACAIMLLVLSRVQEIEARKAKVCDISSSFTERPNKCDKIGDKNNPKACVEAFAQEDKKKVFQCECSATEELFCFCKTAC